MAPMHAPIPFGKYRLTERIGRGGMAEVWRASMVGPGGFTKTLVVKRILPELVRDPHFVEMFLAEASLCARLNHANIVPVYELGDVDGEYFLAMEYVVGHDLVDVLRALQGWPPPPGLGAYVVREVCRALAYAHALTDDNGAPLRLVHRDVTPSNVMLAIDGHVRLLDFGIAKMLADVARPKTETGTLKGKFGYMSPEQADGYPLDHRSDLFSVGVLLHELLTGRRLFRGDHDLQTLALIRHATVPPPSALNGEVPPALDEVCLRALNRRPEARYPGCAEMAAALDPIVRELHFGAEQLSALLAERLPAPRTGSGDSALLERHDTDAAPPPRRRRWIAPAILIPVAGIALALGARAGWHRPQPPPVVVVPVTPVARRRRSFPRP